MNRTTLSILAILLLQAAAAAAPTATAEAECTNHGILVARGSGGCDECTNHGVVVMAGSSCWADGAAAACVESKCVSALTQSEPQPVHDETGDPRWEAEEPCGMLDDPDCWSSRFGCYYYGRQLALIPRGHWTCETQPGALDEESDGGN